MSQSLVHERGYSNAPRPRIPGNLGKVGITGVTAGLASPAVIVNLCRGFATVNARTGGGAWPANQRSRLTLSLHWPV
jgi:hypothetical protein